MPPTRSKNKKRITKITTKENVRQPIDRRMKTRLMVISLKADEYIYKQKPISIQEAETYAREMEAFRTQCQDERYLQVIEKLTGYMKCIIREQAPQNIIDAKIMNPVGNPIEDAAPVHSAIIDLEMERSFSNLSIATDPTDPLADMDNIDIHQEKTKKEHPNSAVTKGIFKKVENYTVAHTNKEPDTSNLPPMPVDKKQKEIIVSESNVESQNILSNFEFENHTSLSSLRNYRNSTNKQIQSVEYAVIKIVDAENTNTGNYTNKPEMININYIEEKEIVDDNSKLSPNLLNDFYYKNNSDAVVSQNPRNYQIQGNEISSNIANTINMGTNCSNKDIGKGRTKLEEVKNLKTIKQKDLGSDSTKISQNILSNFENGNNAVSRFLKNDFKSSQLSKISNHVNERPNNIADGRCEVTNSSYMNIGKCDTKSKMSNLNDIQQIEKELDVSQNILGNFENEKYAAVGIVQNNRSSKNYQTKQMNDTRHTSNDDTHSKSNLVQHKTFKPSTLYDIQDNTIFKRNTQNIFMPPKMMQLDITNNPSQKQKNQIETRKKRKTSAKNVIAEAEKKRPYSRKNKVNGVTTARIDLGKKKGDAANQEAKHPENKSQQKKGTFLRKKIQEIDISWVENMKFVRAIDTDEYFKFDSLEESFWTDLSLPSNMSVIDFEYDQINIWKN